MASDSAKPPFGQVPAQRWVLGSLIIYAPDLMRARRAYERILEDSALKTVAFGTVTLDDGTPIRWVSLDRTLYR